jgi:CRP/FNR family cyclic AMP-dependent transcriptional regulator
MIVTTNKSESFKTILKENIIFSNLEESILDEFISNLKYKKWEKRLTFFYENETLQNFHIIISGRVKIFQMNENTNRDFTVFLLKKHDIFDVVSLLDYEKRSTNFKALDDTEILSMPMKNAREWIALHPEINKTLLPYLGKRMRMLEENRTETVLTDIPTRLAKLIAKNINESSQELQLINDLSHNEIAGLIGSTRAVINRHLQVLKKEGILDTKNKSTKILNLEKLLKKMESKI